MFTCMKFANDELSQKPKIMTTVTLWSLSDPGPACMSLRKMLRNGRVSYDTHKHPMHVANFKYSLRYATYPGPFQYALTHTKRVSTLQGGLFFNPKVHKHEFGQQMA